MWHHVSRIGGGMFTGVWGLNTSTHSTSATRLGGRMFPVGGSVSRPKQETKALRRVAAVESDESTS